MNDHECRQVHALRMTVNNSSPEQVNPELPRAECASRENPLGSSEP